MKQLQIVLTNGFFILILYVIILLSVLIVVEMQPVAANDLAIEPVVAPAGQPDQTPADAPERDITQQRFAPLEASPEVGSQE